MRVEERVGLRSARVGRLEVKDSTKGIRTAVVRALAIPDLTTTVLSLTVAGIAADSSWAGGANPRLTRRLMSVAAMLAGASAGALLFSRAPAYVLLVAAVLEAIATLSLPRQP